MKIYSKSVDEHDEVPVADDGRADAVVARWSAPDLRPAGGAACYVVSVGRAAQEILGLVEANGGIVVGHEAVRLTRRNPRTFLGSGACDSLGQRAREVGATLLVFDAQLSPSQTRNIEDATGLPVSDREIVILGVFRRHARSRAARIQIEIAHLHYLRPRIRGLGLDMDQQAGGVMNGRGAGETASELLARQLDGRLVVLQRAAAKVERASAQRRRRRDGCARIALVGYTNAGKTSLMNALTGSALSTRSRPFETLDTTSRCLTRHGGEVVLGDTVGFIRELPARLLASFSSTLAQAREASLLALVVDLSDPEWPMHLRTTVEQLQQLGADEIPRMLVFNKVDLLPEPIPEETLAAAAEGHPFRTVSSFDAQAVDALRDAVIAAARAATHTQATLFVPYAATGLSSEIYRSCAVRRSEARSDGVRLTVEGPTHVVARLSRMAGELR